MYFSYSSSFPWKIVPNMINISIDAKLSMQNCRVYLTILCSVFICRNPSSCNLTNHTWKHINSDSFQGDDGGKKISGYSPGSINKIFPFQFHWLTDFTLDTLFFQHHFYKHKYRFIWKKNELILDLFNCPAIS